MSEHGFGIIALAAFQPDPDLFRCQLKSIQAQTYTEFCCLISADGGAEEVCSLVAEATAGDSRFHVLGHDERLGFYHNFERVLRAVPTEATWVALSDQDDDWYPNKLEVLLPHLHHCTLVAGQARVVNADDGAVLLAKTHRKIVPFADLLFQNQVTGAQAVFRRDLLDLALPFPRLHTVTQVHDHWLAVCASARAGYEIVDIPLQDYAQHSRNVIGEYGARRGAWWAIAAKAQRFSKHAEVRLGSPLAVARAANRLSFGWRRTLVEELSSRLELVPDEVVVAREVLALGLANVQAARFLKARLTSGNVDLIVLASFLAGFPYELFRRLRERRSHGPMALS